MPSAANNPAPVKAPAMRALSCVVRATLMAPTSCAGGMMSASNAPRTPRSDGRIRPMIATMIMTLNGDRYPDQRQRHRGRGQRRVDKAHHDEEIAVTHAVPDHPEHRRDQGADILQRGEHGQQQHRAGLDHDVPAEHQRLDLERPGGEQIGRPLKAIVSDAEWREDGSPRRSTQDAITRFTACPALFLFFSGNASLFERR